MRDANWLIRLNQFLSQIYFPKSYIRNQIIYFTVFHSRKTLSHISVVP